MESVAGKVDGGNLAGVIRIEEEKIRSHVGEVVRQTLNGLLEAEADDRSAALPERVVFPWRKLRLNGRNGAVSTTGRKTSTSRAETRSRCSTVLEPARRRVSTCKLLCLSERHR